MGIQKNIALKGTVDNIIYYQWKGINCIRQKPATVQQSAKSMELADLFGRAARCSTITRSLLLPVSPQQDKRPLMYRMNKAFRNWFGSSDHLLNTPQQAIPAFEGLSLNEAAALPAIFATDTIISREPGGQVSIGIPAMEPTSNITAPSHTHLVACHFLAVALPIAQPETACAVQMMHTIPYTNGLQPASSFVLPVQPQAGTLILVGMALKFITAAKHTNELLRWQPAGIVGSFYN